MHLPKYPLESGASLTTFEFISIGPKGRIPKIVQFTPTNLKEVYNLSFGDKNLKSGKIDDTVISNNNDSEKILSTVVSTVYAFTDKNPDTYIYATGSTKSRTRLYRIGITKYISEIEETFEIYGELKDGWEKFKKGTEYDGFLVIRKKS